MSDPVSIAADSGAAFGNGLSANKAKYISALTSESGRGTLIAIFIILFMMGSAYLFYDLFLGFLVSKTFMNIGPVPQDLPASLWLEAQRQINFWLGIANFHYVMGIVGGAIAASLTVIIGLMKDQGFSKMFLMALSASISFLLGFSQPNEEYQKYMRAWRALYAEVVRIQAIQRPTDADAAHLAKVLANAESSLNKNTAESGLGSPPADADNGGKPSLPRTAESRK